MFMGSMGHANHKGVTRIQRVQHTITNDGSLNAGRYSSHDRSFLFRLIMVMGSMGHASHKGVARVQRVQHTRTNNGSLHSRRYSRHDRVVSFKLIMSVGSMGMNILDKQACVGLV